MSWGTAHILGDGFKSMTSPFFYQDIGINELNPKLNWILFIFVGLTLEKPVATTEICNLIEFVTLVYQLEVLPWIEVPLEKIAHFKRDKLVNTSLL